MARKHSKHDPYGDLHREEEAWPRSSIAGLCGRPTGKTIVRHHPVPKSRGGRDVVPDAPHLSADADRQFHQFRTATARAWMWRACWPTPNVRKFVDWVAKKDPDFTATTTKKQR